MNYRKIFWVAVFVVCSLFSVASGEKSSSLDGIVLEAEQGILTDPMIVQEDKTASGYQYVCVPEGVGDVKDITTQGGAVEFTVNIPRGGFYDVRARVKAPTGTDNSFFVSIDGAKKEWHVPELPQWQWAEYQKAVRLKKGSHTLIFSQREDGTAIDQIKIIPFQAFNPSLTKKRILKPPFEMPEVKEPTFPERSFNIKDYGAVADGTTKNTDAFAKAIDACFAAGGGTVLVPEGQWYTGPIHFKNNINLHLAEGSEIVFSDDFEDYLPVVLTRWTGVECYNYSPLIYAKDCVNIAITGKGNIDGNGDKWWHYKSQRKSQRENIIELIRMGEENVPVKERIFGVDNSLRPPVIQTINCKNIFIEGVSFIGGGPFWTMDLVYSENIICRGLTFINSGPNNDGINPDSSKNVIIEDCYFQTADDAVAIKSGRNAEGRRIGIPSENIIVRNCQSVNSRWGTISIGSEMSGGVKNVFVHDCYFERSNSCFFFKTTRQRGGIVENVWIQDIEFKDARHRVFYFTMRYGDYSKSDAPGPGIFRNIHIKNIKGNSLKDGLTITGLDDYPFGNVTIDNLEFSADWGMRMTNVKNLDLNKICVRPRKGPLFDINKGQDVSIEAVCIEPGHELAAIHHAESDDIRIETGSTWSGDTKVLLSPEVLEKAVEVKSQSGRITIEKLQPVKPEKN